MKKWVILADDFTGAFDTGAQFASTGYQTFLILNSLGKIDRETADVIILSSDSREVLPSAAESHVRKIVRNIPDERRIYKKIDSALRGNLEDEILAVMSESGYQKALICSAAPLQGRTISDGVLFVNGVPIDQTDFRNDPKCPIKNAAIVRFFAKKQPALCDLSVIHQGVDPVKQFVADCNSELILCDAQTEEDLLTLGQVCVEDEALLPCGSNGFAKAIRIAEKHGDGNAAGSACYQDWGMTEEYQLILSGSAHPKTERQLALMKEKTQTGFFPITPQDSKDEKLAEILTAIESGIRTIVITQASRSLDPIWRNIGDLISEIGGDLVRVKPPGKSIIIGGQTAAAFFKQVDIDRVFVKGEVEAGVPWGIMKCNAKEIQIISKAGSFGSEDLLLKLVEKL